MDSITQAALGAAVGEAVLGRKIGNRAPIWGAVFGTIPDLDVFMNGLMTQVEQLSWHRGPSHSILFALLLAPPAALLLGRLHRKYGVEFRHWTLFVFLTVVTHPLLDALTNYGTQLFWPFTDWPVAWPTISIVDPLYTLPLLVGVIGAMIVRDPERSRRWNGRGLKIASIYLALTMVNKVIVDQTFRSALNDAGIPYERMMISPSFFNNVLWQGLAQNDHYVWSGVYSHLDDDRPIRFQQVAKRDDLLEPYRGSEAVEKLLWFSMGYHRVVEREGELHFDDYHVARMDALSGEATADVSVFSFRLLGLDEGPVRFEQRSAEGEVDLGRAFDMFGDRIGGKRYPWEEESK